MFILKYEVMSIEVNAMNDLSTRRIRAPYSGAARISLTHAADRKLQVVAFRERRQDRVVKCGAVQGFELPLAAGLPRAVLDTCQKVILPEVAGAR